jgi:hypothetical protein
MWRPFNASGTLEAVVAVPLKPDREDCVPVSRLLVLRHDPTGWKPAFEAGPHSEIKNPEGYVGIDYIDDSDLYPSYCLKISDAKGGQPFLISISFIASDDQVDEGGIPLDIAWNSKVLRYLEIVSGDGPVVFAAEKKDVPHIHLK